MKPLEYPFWHIFFQKVKFGLLFHLIAGIEAILYICHLSKDLQSSQLLFKALNHLNSLTYHFSWNHYLKKKLYYKFFLGSRVWTFFLPTCRYLSCTYVSCWKIRTVLCFNLRHPNIEFPWQVVELYYFLWNHL